jgi:hypothetical protein
MESEKSFETRYPTFSKGSSRVRGRPLSVRGERSLSNRTFFTESGVLKEELEEDEVYMIFFYSMMLKFLRIEIKSECRK